MTISPDWREATPLDFRSQRFAVDALALVRLSGQPLELCRQELFIAEGDAAEAYLVLLAMSWPAPSASDLH
ncbi:MAG: hypothetical protein ABIN37_13065 [Burkholderiaceae bacterium]